MLLAAELTDLDRWHADYQRMRDELAESAAPAARKRTAAPDVPAQLPAGAPFTGRAEQLATLDALVRAGGEAGHPATVVISAIDGTAGVGKTALAVHWAHRIAGRFPDGQLYINLRGFDTDSQALDPASAVRGFLDALGVPVQRVPATLDAQTSLYRSLLAHRRMLVVLDNARDTAQVRPLLPAGAGCLVVVTSRNQLTGLVAGHGAHPVTLDLLTAAEAEALLAQRLGADRVGAEPAAVAEIIERCAGLPLALAVVAAQARMRPRTSLRSLAGELAGPDRPTGDDPATDLHTVFSWSIRTLSEPAARLFRLLGLHAGPDAAGPAVASLAGRAEAGPLLAELLQANLITEPTPGRYAMHDLLRAYAAHLAAGDEDSPAAVRRLLDHYRHTAYADARMLNPELDPIDLGPPPAGVAVARPADLGEAQERFTAERAALLAAVDQAVAAGLDAHACHLAASLSTFLDRGGHWHDHATLCRTALAAGERLGDRTAQALAHRMLGNTHNRVGRIEESRAELIRALELYREAGQPMGQARSLMTLGLLAHRQNDIKQALDHVLRASELYRAAGNLDGQAHALNNSGWCQVHLGDYEAAVATCDRALTIHESAGNQPGLASTWDTRGYACFHLGRHAEALECFGTALGLFRDLGDRYQEADTLTRVGETHAAAGDDGAATEAYGRALEILDDLNHPDADAVRARLGQPHS